MKTVLVTGATGYIGGRLIPRLLERGHRVRVLVRDASRVVDRPWSGGVDVFEGDVQDRSSLGEACRGVDAAYYLVHAMCSGDDFAAQDREGARNFVAAAQGLRHLIYLGGLVPAKERSRAPSKHLRSRAEVGRILREGLPTTEFRAGPIIGSGSASFEMVRYLTERLPAMIAPRWILNRVEPIAVRDVVAYLLAALDQPDALGVIDVGGGPLTFKQMMEQYAQVRGLPRVIVPVPVLAPRLAALWVGLVTPIPNCLAVPLIEGVAQPLVADRSRARALFPDIEPVRYRVAVERALRSTDELEVATRWSGATRVRETVTLEDREGVIREERTRFVKAAATDVFRTFATLGGERGWLVWDRAWRLRGLIDRLVGGPGLRRGRRHPHEVLPGEAVDFWRVEQVREPEMLLLRAEMRVPGRAWLRFQAVPEADGTRLVQTAFFAPTGLFGALYWYGLYPLHALIFSDLVDAIASEAEASCNPDRPHRHPTTGEPPTRRRATRTAGHS